MNLEKLESAAAAMKALIREQKTYERLRDKAGVLNGSPRQMQKTDTDMHYSAMELRRLQKAAWRAIKEAGIETSLDEEVAHPFAWHKFKIS